MGTGIGQRCRVVPFGPEVRLSVPVGVRAELPGIDPSKDIEIGVTEGVMTLRVERREETSEKHHTECRYGSFARSVRLPAGAKGDEATAEYRDGVLTVSVPVPETKTGTRTIPVHHV
ncbi:Hsp20/alpha crystallin family protein [Streptomyces mirabilis]|uniref:Hsp20/alpha crystallin family protein n=1 Tax=Streptomyces mirabilis TaxID=68239 RepID=UPI0036B105D0